MYAKTLLDVLEGSVVEALRGDESAAVAYSGGIDSALIVELASRHSSVVRYTCGTAGSRDLADAVAHQGQSTSTVIEIDDATVKRLCATAVKVLGDHAPVPISYTVPVLAVTEAAKERVVLVGSGADELFAGYAKYSGMADPAAQMNKDLDKMLSELGLLNRHLAPTGKRVEAPFVGSAVVRLADTIPLDSKIGPAGRKLVLREAARSLGLAAHDRPKRAAQYSSGVLKAMERMAKRDGKTLGEWTAGLAPHASP